MSRRLSVILALLLLLVGIGVFIYPTLSDYISEVNGSYAIQEMTDRLHQTERETLVIQRQLAEEYNAKISGRANWNSNTPAMGDYENIMNFGNGIMGYIQIPEIEVSLPIYHGVSDEVLSKGVGHLPETAFPIGGEGNHPVLSSHTGLPGAELFTDLVELEPGDRFYLSVLEQTLAYKVDQVRVVLPNEVEDLAPVPGEDYCTLVTCTPYGVNSHRLLVRGERVEIDQEVCDQLLREENGKRNFPLILVGAGVASGLILVAVFLLLFWRKRWEV